MSSHYRHQLEEYLRDLDVKAARVLDVGGAQKPAKGRTRSWEVGEYRIMDLAEPHKVEQAPDIVMDLNTARITDVGPLGIGCHFDLILCLEVAEYLYDPVHAFGLMRSMAVTDGTLIASFPFIYPVHNPMQHDALRYTPNGAEKILNAAGWTVRKLMPRLAKDRNRLFDFYASDGMRPSREFEGHAMTGFIVEARAVGP